MFQLIVNVLKTSFVQDNAHIIQHYHLLSLILKEFAGYQNDAY